jgi:putative NADH-flavin reductase
MRIALLGASGRTGLQFLEQALAQGHSVNALVRAPARLTLRHPNLTLTVGSARDPAALVALLAGCDAVVSTLGPSLKDKTLCSETTERLLPHLGQRRLLVVSGAMVDLPGDAKGLSSKLISWLVRTAAPTVYADRMREAALLRASDARWTLVRPPQLLNGAPTRHYTIDATRPPGGKVQRADMATFMLHALTDATMVGAAPFISG